MTYSVSDRGRIDIARDTHVNGKAGWRVVSDDRGSPDTDASDAEPTEYSVANGELAAAYCLNRLSLRWSGAIDAYDYSNTPRVGNGATDNQDRDRTDYKS